MELVIAVVGSSVGAAVAGSTTAVAFGMTGAQLGWMAGSIIGSLLFSDSPEPVSAGISDLRVQGSTYGTVIPYAIGTSRMGGQIIWSSNKTTTRSSTSGTTEAAPVSGESPGNDQGSSGNFGGETDRGGGSFSTSGVAGPG